MRVILNTSVGVGSPLVDTQHIFEYCESCWPFGWRSCFRPCQNIYWYRILLSVNSSLTNLGTYSQKNTNRKRKHIYFTTKTMHYIYFILLLSPSHHHQIECNLFDTNTFFLLIHFIHLSHKENVHTSAVVLIDIFYVLWRNCKLKWYQHIDSW